MTEQEKAFLMRLREKYGPHPFYPAEAVEDFRLSEVPPSYRVALVVHGPGVGATKALVRWLVSVAGAERLPLRTARGYAWRLP